MTTDLLQDLAILALAVAQICTTKTILLMLRHRKAKDDA